MLHLISQMPMNAAPLERIGAGDDVLLLEAAVCTSFKTHAFSLPLQALQNRDCTLFVLQSQLTAYGIEPERLLSGIRVIDYQDFVELTVKNPVSQTWR